MTTYEQHTIDSIIEVIDQDTGKLLAQKLILTCEKDCILCGEPFMEGEEIEATFPARCDLTPGEGGEGPWEPGGFTSRWIRNNALEISELSRGKTIYTKPFLRTCG